MTQGDEEGYMVTTARLGESGVGYLEFDHFSYPTTTGPSAGVRVWKHNPKTTGFDDLVFKGTLQELIDRLSDEGFERGYTLAQETVGEWHRPPGR